MNTNILIKNKALFLLLIFSFFITACLDNSGKNLLDPTECETGYTGDNCDLCIDAYVKDSKLCIYDCSDIENIDGVNEANDNCVCKEGYSFNKTNRVCDEMPLNCSHDRDCELGNICDISNGLEIAVCAEGCRVDRDCESDKVCDTTSNKCKENIPNEDCRLEFICEQGYDCNQESGVCELKAFCETNEDCMLNYECNNTECIEIPKCLSNDDCKAGEICKEDNYCGIDTGCESDDYCINKDLAKPTCNIDTGICYECIDNTDCSDNKVCGTLTSTCIEESENHVCFVDSDCGLNEKCDLSSPNKCVDIE